jgi:tetratricopeptide (TPR) repeat protein
MRLPRKRARITLPRTFAMMAVLLAQQPAAAQDVSARYRVLAPPLAPLGGAKAGFGKDVAKRFREAIEAFPRHAPFEGGELRAALRRYEVEEEELARDRCAKGLQLAGLVGIPLVLCGSYAAVANGMEVTASIISPEGGDRFDLASFIAADARQAAQEIVRQFEGYIQALSYTVFCQDDVRNEAWSTALEKCAQALAANPNGRTALYLRATALWKLDSLETSLTGFQRVIELDPFHQDALKAAGIVATLLGRRDLGRAYFAEVLRLNPADLDVRLAIIADLAQAGDPEGGLTLLEEVLAADSVDIALFEYAGQLALAAALKPSGEACGVDCPMSGEARALFVKAYDYLHRAMDAEPSEADSTMLGNMAVVLNKLGRTDEMLHLADRVQRDGLDVNANFWIAHAEALKESGDAQGAIQALGRAAQKNPAAKVYGRMTAWLMESGHVDAAVDSGRLAVQRNELDTNTFAKMIAVGAYNTRAKANEHDEAIAFYETARDFAQDAEPKAMIDFFHGFSILRQAIALEASQTLDSARRTLPMFERARDLIRAGQGYDWSASSIAQLLDNAQAYIAIEQAIIKRGR